MREANEKVIARGRDDLVGGEIAMFPDDGHAVAPYVEPALVRHGATRTDLLRTAMNAWAPQPVVERLLALPEGYYRNLDEVLAQLA